MVKIIKFTNMFAIWSDAQINIPDRVCRSTENIDVLPKESLLEFSCEEVVLASVKDNRKLLKEMVDIYLIP